MKRFLLFALCVFFAFPSFGAKPEIDSQWNGARVAFLGDSITDARQLDYQDIYWHQLIPILGIEPYCYGISGRRCDDIKAQTEKLLSEHGQDVDAIIIFIGTNDFNGSVPLGQWFVEEVVAVNRNGQEYRVKHRSPVMDANTVRSDINKFMSFIKHAYPTKQVILLTPIHRAYFNCADNNVQPDENYANPLGLYIDDYVNVIKEAGNVWAVPVIDLNSICALYPLEPAHKQYFRESAKDPDGVRHDCLHPNTEGHLRISYALAYQLLGYPARF